jgi:hypothetical protein
LSTHHDGCFGCGQANLFGLQLENGRFFVKQDHQGARGFAHRGIIAAALYEALTGTEQSSVPVREQNSVPVGERSSVPVGERSSVPVRERLEIEFFADVPVGVFVEVGASGGGAEARVDGNLVASARVPAPK